MDVGLDQRYKGISSASSSKDDGQNGDKCPSEQSVCKVQTIRALE